MKRPGVAMLVLAVLAGGCGPRRIAKRPVPREAALRSFALMGAGDRLLREGKDHLALIRYLEASRLNPYYEVIFNKLAVAYLRLHRWDPARRAIDRAVALNHRYAFAFNTRGILDLATGHNKRAIRSFRRAIRLRAGEANFFANLGYAYLRSGRLEKGRQAYARALQLDPGVFGNAEVVEVGDLAPGETDPEKLYRMARIFGQLGNSKVCLDYLGRALAAGFKDYQRLRGDRAFQLLREDPAFVRLLRIYGIEGKKGS